MTARMIAIFHTTEGILKSWLKSLIELGSERFSSEVHAKKLPESDLSSMYYNMLADHFAAEILRHLQDSAAGFYHQRYARQESTETIKENGFRRKNNVNKILVGDDDVDFADYYQKPFQKVGYSAVITQDGQACLEVYQKEFSKVNPFQSDNADDKPIVFPFDVVILEYKPPKMNGIEVAKKILEQNRRQKIMFISSVAEDLMYESVHHLHKMVELVRKSFDPRGLVETIEDVEANRMFDKMNEVLELIIESRTDPEELSELLRRFRDKLDGKDSS